MVIVIGWCACTSGGVSCFRDDEWLSGVALCFASLRGGGWYGFRSSARQSREGGVQGEGAKHGKGEEEEMEGEPRQVHPGMGISSKAMSIMNSFVDDTFERIAAESFGALQQEADHHK